MTEADALKPCPFVHDEDGEPPAVQKTAFGWNCECPVCEAIGPLAGTPEDAIAAWNARAPLSPPTDAEVEALIDALYRNGSKMPWIAEVRAALSAFIDKRNRA